MKIDQLFDVKGKVALVTGGSRGIGEMIAAAFLANGVKVYISARKADPCDQKAMELSEMYGSECISIPADVGSMDGIVKLTEEIKAREDRLDFLINNAGAAWGESIDDFSESGWDKVMDLNVKGMFFTTQKLLPLLRKSGTQELPAKVINIGSIDGINTPAFENYVYSASKAAVHKLTRHLASKLVKENILVNAIAPGPFPSRMLGSAVAHDFTPLEERSPVKRIGTKEDIGGLAIYLCSRAGNFTIGETITCDGGLTACSGHNLSV